MWINMLFSFHFQQVAPWLPSQPLFQACARLIQPASALFSFAVLPWQDNAVIQLRNVNNSIIKASRFPSWKQDPTSRAGT